MGAFFQQFFTLLTTETGSLTYHLVLAFSIAWALQAAFSQWRSNELPQGQRMVTGLSLLLLTQLILFFGAGLAWQNLVDAGLYLPLLDRGVTLVSLLLIVWLWAFPEPLRPADTAALLLGLLTLTLIALGIVWWTDHAGGAAFNGSWPDFIAGVAALILIVIGALLLLLRRPNGWGVGFAMLSLLFAGHTIHLLNPLVTGNYPGAVRLAQMAAFPLLLVLPQRFSSFFTHSQVVAVPQAEETGAAFQGLHALQSFFDLAAETDLDQICQGITRNIALYMPADLCLLIAPPGESNAMSIRFGYDAIRHAFLQPVSLDARAAPALASVMHRLKPLRLPDSSTSSDLAALANLLNLERAGPMLAAPIHLPRQLASAALILLSPYSNYAWTVEDQEEIVRISGHLALFLHHRQESQALQGSLEAANNQLEQAQVDRQRLLDQIEILNSSADQHRTQLDSMAAVLGAQAETHESIDRLQAENDQLRKLLQELPDATQAQEDVAGELRLALQEVALLQAALAEAKQKMAGEQPVLPGGFYHEEQKLAIASIARELRQPMSSIVGYTDFLLGESIGILGASQRRLLERIHASTERMGKLLDELVGVTSPEMIQMQQIDRLVDPNNSLEAALAQAAPQFQAKKIALQLELHADLPHLKADPQALHQILVHLLENAGSVTPAEGEVALRACVESSAGEQDYLLIRVSDHGGGIPYSELPRIFSPRILEEKAFISGISETGVGLAFIKTLVESQGGRIWVDSELGRGATFSLLFPVPIDGDFGGLAE